MSDAHKCSDGQCDGQKLYQGISIMCKNCLTASYLGCLTNNKEIDLFIKVIGIDKLKAKDKNTDNIWMFVNTLFSDGSMFSFRCPECFYDAEIKLKQLKQSVDEKSLECAELKKKLGDHMNNSNMTPLPMNTNATEPITYEKLDTILRDFEKSILDKVDMMSNSGQANKRKRPNILTPTIANPLTPITVRDKSLKHYGLLKPATKKAVNDRSIYEIHISKFDSTMTANDLTTFIISNTNIESDKLFKVEQLQSTKTNKVRETVSFKVTTLSQEVYTKIMSTSLWEPEFVARDFVHNQRNVTRENYTRRKVARNNYQRNEPPRNLKRDSQQHNNQYQTPNRNRVQFETPKQNNIGRYTPKRTPRTGNFLPRFAQTQYNPPPQFLFIPPQQHQQQFLQQSHQFQGQTQPPQPFQPPIMDKTHMQTFVQQQQ